jgi:hypothetical protein
MRNYFAQECRRRPTLDPLESRYLPSGGLEVVGVPAAPALVIGIEFREPFRPGAVFGNPAMLPVSSGPADWPMQMPRLHHDFTSLAGQVLPPPGFQGFQGLPDPQTASAWMTFKSASEAAASSPPISRDGSALLVPPMHGDTPPGSPPPPFPWPPLPFQAGDLGRIKLDDSILHAARGLPPLPLPFEMTLGSAGNAGQTDGVTVSPAGNQAAGPAVGGNSNVSVAPSAVATPMYLTTLSNPQSWTNDPSIRIARGGESPGKQRNGTAQGNLPRSASASLVMTDDSTADADAHRGGDVPATSLDPIVDGNQVKLPLPHAAGLIANVVPFDRASLEQAVDQFFNQLEDLGMGRLVEQGPTHVIPLSLALLGTVTAVEVARRRLRSRTALGKAPRRQDPLASEELLGFPELPGSWSTKLT